MSVAFDSDDLMPALSVHQLGRDAHQVVRDLPGSGRVVPVSRNGEVVGVIVETSLPDLAARGLADRADRFVSVREFVRGNMSRHVGMVADEGEALVVWKWAQPTLIMLPYAEADAAGLFDDEGSARPGPDRSLTAEETSSGLRTSDRRRGRARA
jgi:hypothetical protein